MRPLSPTLINILEFGDTQTNMKFLVVFLSFFSKSVCTDYAILLLYYMVALNILWFCN